METGKGQSQKTNPMAGTWTKAAQVRRAFKAGPPRKKDYVLTPAQAILQGAMALLDIQTAMREAGLPEEDANVSLVLMPATPASGNDPYMDDVSVIEPLTIEELSKSYENVKALKGVWLPAGLKYWQLDRELPALSNKPGQPDAWTHRWLVNDRARKALFEAVAEW